MDPSTKVTVGYDATTDAMAYIKQGKLGATMDQFPGKQASQALQFLYDYIKNKTQPTQEGHLSRSERGDLRPVEVLLSSRLRGPALDGAGLSVYPTREP